MDIKENAKQYAKNSLFGSKAKAQVAYNAYLKGAEAVLNMLQYDVAIKVSEFEADEPHLACVDDLIAKYLMNIKNGE